MSSDHVESVARLLAAVEAIAVTRQDGALLRIEAEAGSLERLRQGGAPPASVAEILLQASQIAASSLQGATSARTAWNRYELALSGARETLGARAGSLVAELIAHPACGRLSWLAILTRIFPGEAIRTHHCDPGYDLARIRSSAVVWVDPYPGDDWKQAQRYPTLTVLWKAG